jgi:hypothetical protein
LSSFSFVERAAAGRVDMLPQVILRMATIIGARTFQPSSPIFIVIACRICFNNRLFSDRFSTTKRERTSRLTLSIMFARHERAASCERFTSL